MEYTANGMITKNFVLNLNTGYSGNMVFFVVF